jgi:hypothetical protein
MAATSRFHASSRNLEGDYAESVLIGSKSVELIGGHVDCSTTSPTAISQVICDISPAIVVIAATGDRSLSLTS